MKNLKKLMACITIVGVLAAAGVANVTASTTKTKTMSGSNEFLKECEYTRIYYLNDHEVGRMVYGYDTFLINEDYTWTKGKECDTKAKVQRIGLDSKYIAGSQAGIGSYSKIEVTHKKNAIKYALWLSASYGDKLTVKTSKSAVK